ncbi:hypothetical protein P1P70_02890 [Streptomyces sp. MB09-02B]|nr:hypothetical protein [Streptomyces sp. MB09-02B]
MGDARGVVVGVEDDQDLVVIDVPTARLDQLRDHSADLGRGDLGDIGGGTKTDAVQ